MEAPLLLVSQGLLSFIVHCLENRFHTFCLFFGGFNGRVNPVPLSPLGLEAEGALV